MALGARPWHLVREHLTRHGRGVLTGILAGSAVVLLARPLLLWFAVDLRPPEPRYVALAAALLALLAGAGLCAPLRSLLRVDLTRTLDPR
jgi:hypothetical protein